KEPATDPANDTTPSPAARAGVPGAAARSMPRWPGPYANAGAWNGRTTAPSTGGSHVAQAGGADGVGAGADAGSDVTRNNVAARQTASQSVISRCGCCRRMGFPVSRTRQGTGKRQGSRHGAAARRDEGRLPGAYDNEKRQSRATARRVAAAP